MPDTKSNNLSINPPPPAPAPSDAASAESATNTVTRTLESINESDSTNAGDEALLRFIADTLTNIQQELAANTTAPTNAPATPIATAVDVNAPASDEVLLKLPALSTATNSAAQPDPNAQPNASGTLLTTLPASNTTNAPTQVPAPATSNGANSPFDDATFSSILNGSESDTQSLQASADQVRRAFEQNSQTQLLLYQQLLEALGAQNQKLNDLEHRTAELTNQIRSLKNP